MALLLEDKFSDWGGNIQLNTVITEIHASDSVVVDSEGRRHEYDQLIWAADPSLTATQVGASG